jgi:hypothetical protein
MVEESRRRRRLLLTPHRVSRPDTLDAALLAHLAFLLAIGIWTGSALPSILNGAIFHAVVTEALFIAALTSSCVLSRKYIGDSDGLEREGRNLLLHQILCGPIPIFVIPGVLTGLIFLFSTGGRAAPPPVPAPVVPVLRPAPPTPPVPAPPAPLPRWKGVFDELMKEREYVEAKTYIETNAAEDWPTSVLAARISAGARAHFEKVKSYLLGEKKALGGREELSQWFEEEAARSFEGIIPEEELDRVRKAISK